MTADYPPIYICTVLVSQVLILLLFIAAVIIEEI